MKRIYKYPVYIIDHQTLPLPRGAQILSIQFQQQQLCLWALIDVHAAPEPVELHCFGTGHPIPDKGLCFIATVQTDGQYFVWHFFRE